MIIFIKYIIEKNLIAVIMPWKKRTILRRMTKTSLECSNVNHGCGGDVVDAHLADPDHGVPDTNQGVPNTDHGVPDTDQGPDGGEI